MEAAYVALGRQDLLELERLSTRIQKLAQQQGEILLQVQAQLLEQAVQLRQLNRVAALLKKIKDCCLNSGASAGATPGTAPVLPVAPAVKRMGNYLVEAELLTPAQVYVALADQQMTGLRLGEILVSRGWIKQGTIEFFMEKVILPDRRQRQAQMAPTASKTSKTKLPDQAALAKGAMMLETINCRETICLDPESAL